MNYVNCKTVSLVRAEDSGNLCIKKKLWRESRRSKAIDIFLAAQYMLLPGPAKTAI